MKSWSRWFADRVERRKRAARRPSVNVVIHGYPEQGPVFPLLPPGGPVAPWQADIIARIAAERVIQRERRRVA